MFAFWRNPNGTLASPFFFVTFVTINTFVIINLFIMIIVDELEALDTASEGMSHKEIGMFNVAWGVLDPRGTKFIHVRACLPARGVLDQLQRMRLSEGAPCYWAALSRIAWSKSTCVPMMWCCSGR